MTQGLASVFLSTQALADKSHTMIDQASKIADRGAVRLNQILFLRQLTVLGVFFVSTFLSLALYWYLGAHFENYQAALLSALVWLLPFGGAYLYLKRQFS